jgi:tRNA 5-methylaminomethyl-2-thiouridine biosynthesis bifunctional protein
MGKHTDIENAQVSWQEDGAPYSAEYEDVYFSREGGLAETHHVFLEANDLQARWRAMDVSQQSGVFTVGELGFGTGLNFLCTWRLWQQTGCRNLRLHYISCEKHPLSLAALGRALLQWPELAAYRDALLQVYPDHSAGYHRLRLHIEDSASGNTSVLLDLYYGDALELLNQQSSADAKVDAWFLDGFTPARNPALWRDEILQTIAQRTGAGGTLSSYSVTGRVVRSLQALGFAVEKRAGFGSKRQMLFACRQDAYEADTCKQKPEHVVVIGAGLAGATVARSLAARGVRVTVLEQKAQIADGASGNRQAVVQLRLNRQADLHWQFHVHSYLYALRFYDDLAASSDVNIEWHDCGVLTLDSAYANTRKPGTRADPGSEYGHYPMQVLRAVNVAETENLCGFALEESGLFQPGGGWLNPRACCEASLRHPLITVLVSTDVNSLDFSEGLWSLYDKHNIKLTETEIVVIANSYSARQFGQCAQLPVSPLRGQVSELAATKNSRELRTVVCGERYIAPVADNLHCVGASYVKASEDTQLSPLEHAENCERLGELHGLMAFPDNPPLIGRAAVRGSSRDYMPIAGHVPDPDLPELRYGSSQHFPSPADGSETPDPAALPGLFISIGHGSHGTVSCPLSAEHLASLICGEASPLPRPLAELIDPARFIRRARRKQRSAR